MCGGYSLHCDGEKYCGYSKCDCCSCCCYCCLSQPVGHTPVQNCNFLTPVESCKHNLIDCTCNGNCFNSNLLVTESCKVCCAKIRKSINPLSTATGTATIIIVPGVQENTKDGGSGAIITDDDMKPIPNGSRAPITNHGTNPAEETNDGCVCLYMLTACSYISGSVLTNVIVNTVVAALCGIYCVMNCGSGVCYTCEKPKGTFV